MALIDNNWRYRDSGDPRLGECPKAAEDTFGAPVHCFCRMGKGCGSGSICCHCGAEEARKSQFMGETGLRVGQYIGNGEEGSRDLSFTMHANIFMVTRARCDGELKSCEAIDFRAEDRCPD